MDRLIGTALVILAGLSFGFMAYFNSWARADDIHPFMVLFVRFAIAGVIMAAWMLARGVTWPRGWTLAGLVFMGAGLYVGEALCYFVGLEYAPSAVIALLLYVYPAIVAVLARLFFRELLTPQKLLAMMCALVGTAMMFLRVSAESPLGITIDDSGTVKPLGIVLGLGSAVIYAAYIITGARLTKNVEATVSSTIVIGSAAVVLGALSVGAGASLPNTQEAWLGCVGLALVCTVVAISAFLAGLRRVGPVRASTFSTVEPLTTVIVGATLMSEPSLSGLQLAGGALILLGAVLMALAGDRSPKHA